MFDYQKIYQEVIWYLGEYANSYDIDGIMHDLRDYEKENDELINSIDDVDTDDFVDIMKNREI